MPTSTTSAAAGVEACSAITCRNKWIDDTQPAPRWAGLFPLLDKAGEACVKEGGMGRGRDLAPMTDRWHVTITTYFFCGTPQHPGQHAAGGQLPAAWQRFAVCVCVCTRSLQRQCVPHEAAARSVPVACAPLPNSSYITSSIGDRLNCGRRRGECSKHRDQTNKF